MRTEPIRVTETPSGGVDGGECDDCSMTVGCGTGARANLESAGALGLGGFSTGGGKDAKMMV